MLKHFNGIFDWLKNIYQLSLKKAHIGVHFFYVLYLSLICMANYWVGHLKAFPS